jgi:alpha-galactosidase
MTTYILENEALQLSIKGVTSTWSVQSRATPGSLIEDANLGVKYRPGGGPSRVLKKWTPLSVSSPEWAPSPHGLLHQRQLLSGPDAGGIQMQVTFALPQGLPFLFWKIRLANQGRQAVFIERIDLLQAGFITVGGASLRPANIATGRIRLNPRQGELAFFSNGWQSWSYSGAFGMFDRFRRTRLGPLTSPMRVNAGTPQPRRSGQFASDFFGVLGDRTHRTAILAGFLSQRQHFGSLDALADPVSPALWMWANGDGARLDPGASLETDWACLSFLHLDSAYPLALYLEAVAREHGLSPGAWDDRAAPSGWCSWYHYFQKISAGIIQENLLAAEAARPRLPLELIQIDDGFQAQVGDWLSTQAAFPDGLAPLAAEITRRGFTPGLWLAPFIVHPRSRLAAERPEWLLRNRWGRPVNAGFIWNTFPTALDVTHPQALEYARQVVDTAVHAWGFPYLKLDFLYAAALPGRYRDPTRTRAQALHAGLQALRDAAGAQTTLLGCGCPLGSAIGLVDAMRIGADVAPDWHPTYFGTQFFFKPEPDFPSARNAAHNALTRAPLHRRWWINDPDCLLVRPDSRLTLAEIQTLATVIALTGGSLLLSDDLPALPPERLRIAESLLPLIGREPHVLDWLDSPTPARLQLDLDGPAGRWHLAALFNWRDTPQAIDFKLDEFYLDPAQPYLAREFWSGKVYRISASQRFPAAPAHGCLLLALRPVRSLPMYLGSDLHVSQGLEVRAWERLIDRVSLVLERPGPAAGSVDLYLPRPPQSASLDGASLAWETPGAQIYRFPVRFERSARLDIAG